MPVEDSSGRTLLIELTLSNYQLWKREKKVHYSYFDLRLRSENYSEMRFAVIFVHPWSEVNDFLQSLGFWPKSLWHLCLRKQIGIKSSSPFCHFSQKTRSSKNWSKFLVWNSWNHIHCAIIELIGFVFREIIFIFRKNGPPLCNFYTFFFSLSGLEGIEIMLTGEIAEVSVDDEEMSEDPGFSSPNIVIWKIID